ncbi:MAG: AAA family ATPase [Patescibacteria group bacterium]
MKFILIFGPPAVGKMTVGHELEKLTDFKLFHNHMSIDLVLPFFKHGTPSFHRLNNLFRNELFKEVAKSDLKGFIFTYVWALDEESDNKYVDTITEIFKKEGAEVFYVELEAELDERLKRNKTPHRLEHKPFKRNIKDSERRLLKDDKDYRLNTNENEFQRNNYLKIDNTSLSADKTARLIKDHFDL